MPPTAPLQPGHPPAEIDTLLARLRWRIRAYVWMEGLMAVLLLFCASFWMSLGLDWFFEPPPLLRQIVLVLVVLAGLVVIYRYLIRRLRVRLADRSMALLLERRFSRFRDGLLTTVELSSGDAAYPFSRDMLAHTQREALAQAGQVQLGQVFNARPLVRGAVLSGGLALSVLVFGLLASDAFALWARRSLQFSRELWPRRTRLQVEGLRPGGRVKVARGSDFELQVRAEVGPDRLVPEIVEMRYEADDGAVGRENLARRGVAVAGVDDFQKYGLTVKGLLASRTFYVRGGDAREGPFYLDVVDSPTLTGIVLRCTYPAYTRRGRADIPVTAAMQLPRGTQMTLVARANKDLQQVQLDEAVADAQPVTRNLSLPRGSGRSQREFAVPLTGLLSDTTLLFTLVDTDGIRNREPIRLALSAVADEPPRVNVQLKGIGLAITPRARLPWQGEIIDDYGVQSAAFEHRVVEALGQQPFHAAPESGPSQRLPVDQVFEVEPLRLEPKQKLQIVVTAVDNFKLPGLNEPANQAHSQRYLLDVVTAEQLRAILEARELTLRRRFEVIVEEMTTTRDGMAGIGAAPAPVAAAAVDSPAGAEPGDEPGDQPRARPANLETSIDRRLIQLERAVQNAERSAHETLLVADAFDEIRAELVNNRVDTEELQQRLQQGISAPLRAISQQSFPQLQQLLAQWREVLAESDKSGPARAAALARADAILVEMQAVLDKMLELETFNEVLETLRNIIREQEKLQEKTKEKQKEKLRDLLE